MICSRTMLADRPCLNYASVQCGGEWYCWQHDPEGQNKRKTAAKRRSVALKETTREKKMKEITEHETNVANKKLKVNAIDPADSNFGYAHCRYELNPELGKIIVLEFQNGPVRDVGVNGITHEALIAVILDRLRAFQTGGFKCRENSLAITKLEEALMWLHKRTQNREE